MYTIAMETQKLRTTLREYYSEDMVKSIMIGRAKPSYKNMVKLNDAHKIPFTAWADLPSYLNSTTSKKIME